MSNFNFNNLTETSFVSSSVPHLKPFDIYEVNLTKIEKTTLKGKNDTEYPVVNVEFTGCGENKGIFSNNIFIPNKDEDFERRTNQTSGQMYASAFEQYQYTLMQILQVINPEGAKKIVANASKIKTIDQFTDLVIKGLTNKNDVKVFIKLVGRETNGSWYAALPNACVLAKGSTAESKPSPLNFISSTSDNLSFSNYELNQMKKYKSAKPTDMNKIEKEEETSDNTELDLDDLEV